jgi:hypothetical protein
MPNLKEKLTALKQRARSIDSQAPAAQAAAKRARYRKAMVQAWRMEGLIASHLTRPPRQPAPTVLGRADLVQELQHQAERTRPDGQSNEREGVWINLGASER